ncbi:MAG: primosomal protein N' [Bacilli bacterium]|nr:primosomal protein N' [Bacilli bacterium]
MYANVLIEYPLKTLDKYFIYKVPNELKNVIKVGMQVSIPFGNKKIKGFILEILNSIEKSEYEIKEIIDIINPEIILTKELIELGKFIKEETLCPLITAYQAMLPASLKAKEQKYNYNKYVEYVKLNDNESIVNEYLLNHKRSSKQIELITLLNSGAQIKSDINCSALKTLIDNNIAIVYKEQIYRLNNKENNNIINVLNDNQKKVVNEVIINKHDTYLLYGVTGSGKTEVYFSLIDKVLKENKTALALIPEISLTAQIINRFKNRFGNIISIFHSGLSIGEKHDEYLKVVRGESKIVVGTRSAIFTSFTNLGIIIIDEEQSQTYHQENTPRYNTIEVAKWRGKYNNIPVILGSATPSLESMARAKKNVYKLLELKTRANNGTLPSCIIVDMIKEKNSPIISNVLKEKIKDRLERQEQVILLLNRRGFSTVITCSNCGFTYKCPHCDISLTYHKSSNNLRCHYCGYTVLKSDKCPECMEDGLTFLGTGTEKLENLLTKEFPTSRIVRMDTDTTAKKNAHENIIKSFSNHEYDILLGTQMVSKGLDFPLVTLVAIINADSSLNIPDFRSNERSFELITQASGRAGRSVNPGEVIIQTFNPDNKILEYIKNSDYDNFYNYEMNIRKTLKYPPYYYLTSIKVSSKSYEIASIESNKIVKNITKRLNSDTIVLGPTTASMFKVNSIYNFQILIKYRIDKNLKKVLKEIDDYYLTNKDITLSIMFDPVRL